MSEEQWNQRQLRDSRREDAIKAFLAIVKHPVAQLVIGAALFVASFVTDNGASSSFIELMARALGALGMVLVLLIGVVHMLSSWTDGFVDEDFEKDGQVREFSWYVCLVSLGWLIFFSCLRIA